MDRIKLGPCYLGAKRILLGNQNVLEQRQPTSGFDSYLL